MYNSLYSAWRREVEDNTLGGLEPDFYVRITEYLKSIRKDDKDLDSKSVKLRLLKLEERNVERMLEELLRLRYKKILRTITKIQKAPKELLTREEEEMCESFVTFADSYNQFVKNLMQGKEIQNDTSTKEYIKPEKHVTHKRLTLRFTKNIPAIMGADMKSYGPFTAEDIASLPTLNAQILIKQGLAVLLDFA
ncbi:MAG: hypothetical protein PHY74_04140 [Candidatus Bathyarchaeota archaeon]|nr:hypothetical protein [Candidatus Bathyarchaeota archaeon]MDD4325676.1 hypothetical protein [Candidatus Bathyarchaeota archaeon]MDI9576643.1 hypothetical protein [Thermoproteota archaeon]MDT8783155.1 hypothetical protein [Candidatus Bathyarchaeota archaeon]NLD65710.1 hypothetical protein [Thermoproteota archaeon]